MRSHSVNVVVQVLSRLLLRLSQKSTGARSLRQCRAQALIEMTTKLSSSANPPDAVHSHFSSLGGRRPPAKMKTSLIAKKTLGQCRGVQAPKWSQTKFVQIASAHCNSKFDATVQGNAAACGCCRSGPRSCSSAAVDGIRLK